MNKLQKIVAFTFGAVICASASATDFTDTAQVISATPNYREVRHPRQDCWDEEVMAPAARSRSNAGAIIGGLAGAILGNQVGDGNGRTAATGVGAVIGAITGDRLDNDGSDQYGYEAQHQRRCQTVSDTRRVVNGYTVVYRYNGRDVTVNLPYDPGNYVYVGVGVLER